MRKLNVLRTVLLGFGLLSISLAWSVYNCFMPEILSNYISSAAVIGFLMTIDNYLGLFIQPAVGVLSDRTRTPFGRRMPFLMVGMPLTAVFLLLLSTYINLYVIIISMIFTNLFMSIFRSPLISLMPDITYTENRSMANSILNVMGGFGALSAFFVGSLLWNRNNSYPFIFAAVVMIGAFFIIFKFIKEKEETTHCEKSEEENQSGFITVLRSSNNKNLLLLSGAIFCWFTAYSSVETFFSLYGERYLHIKISDAALSFAFISLSFLLFSIPAGVLGTKFGKKKTILAGISGTIIYFIAAYFLTDINFIRILFVLIGMSWAMININAYPFITDMAPEGQTGTYTGIYYMLTSAAAITAPPLLGAVIDASGYRYMFAFPAFFSVLAFVLIYKVNNSMDKKI